MTKTQTNGTQRKNAGRPPCEHPKNSQVSLRINKEIKELAKEHYKFADEVQTYFITKLVSDGYMNDPRLTEKTKMVNAEKLVIEKRIEHNRNLINIILESNKDPELKGNLITMLSDNNIALTKELSYTDEKPA